MSQHDFLITGGAAPEGSGLNVRLRIQAAFLAAISNSCGATEPTVSYPHMFWVDETTGLLKQRNAANDAWLIRWDITKGQLATLASPTFTGNVTLPSTTYINGKTLAVADAPTFTGTATFANLTATGTVTLPATTSIGSVTAAKLGYLASLTSDVQTQINNVQSTANSKIGAANYASADGTVGGTVKARISGSTLYLTTNGNNA